MNEFETRVTRVVAGLKPGQIATYGEIAEEAGYPGAARAVGNLLAKNDGLPWWRVIRADGSLAARNRTEQGRRLRAEGVRVRNGKVMPR